MRYKKPELLYVISELHGRRFVFNIGKTNKNFGNFICQTVHFGEYLCGNWSTEWVHFAVLNTDIEVF